MSERKEIGTITKVIFTLADGSQIVSDGPVSIFTVAKRIAEDGTKPGEDRQE